MTASKQLPAEVAAATPGAPSQVGTPASLLAAIPHLLGFHPVSSLVVVGTNASVDQALVTIRYGLCGPPDYEVGDAIIRHATRVLTREHCDQAAAVGYGPYRLVALVIELLQETAPSSGLTLTEALRVENGRYWSYQSSQPGCYPVDGMPFDMNAEPIAAAYVASQSPVLASREELAATVAGVTGTAARSMRRATQRAEERAAELSPRALASMGLKAVENALAQYQSGGQLTPGIRAAWLALVLRDLWVRDDAWCRMVLEHRSAHLRLWTDLTRMARAGYVAAPASLLAVVAGQSGHGALANVALDRALADNPQYSMAQLMREAISAGTAPALLRPPMTPEEVAAGYRSQDKGL